MAGTFTPPLTPGTRYRVYMTPRTSSMVYGTEVEVSEHINDSGVNVMQKGIDSQDYAVGVYFYGDIQLVGFNINGYFNEQDSRSIFPYFRDLTKVRVVYENSAGDVISFYGLINEAATQIDALSDTITFKVLSRDSVIRNTQVAGGLITAGMTCKNAMYAILNQASISSVLTISLGNINPTTNFTIDVGSFFDGKPSQDSINSLLLASNSVMTIDASGVLSIKARGVTTGVAALSLYGPFDLQRRQNIVSVSGYNNGLQRVFTSVAITDSNGLVTTFDNIAMAQTYGYIQNQVDFGFLTQAATITIVARALLQEFTTPKVELIAEVPSSVAQGYDLLATVSISWPLRIWPYGTGNFMPIIGTTKIGATTQPLPNRSGSLIIDPNMAFKIIEINEDPNTFTTQLKLRQVGNTLSDGWFSVPTSSIIGYATIGASPIGGTGSTDDQWNPSALGAARVGSTVLSH